MWDSVALAHPLTAVPCLALLQQLTLATLQLLAPQPTLEPTMLPPPQPLQQLGTQPLLLRPPCPRPRKLKQPAQPPLLLPPRPAPSPSQAQESRTAPADQVPTTCVCASVCVLSMRACLHAPRAFTPLGALGNGGITQGVYEGGVFGQQPHHEAHIGRYTLQCCT